MASSEQSPQPAASEPGQAATPAGPETAMYIRSAALTGILLLMVLYTMYVASSLVMPIVLAFLLSLVLSPVMRFLTWLHFPLPLSALIVMLAVATIMAAAVYALAAPASAWLDKAPTQLRDMESKLEWVKKPIKQIQQTKQQVQEAADMGPGSGADKGGGSARRQGSFSLVDAALSQTSNLMYGVSVMLVLLYFVLAAGDSFLNKMVQVTPALHDKRRVVATAREIQHQISTYLSTITLINLIVGVVVALAMYLLQVPNPMLWGALVAVLNFIPYLGVAISIVIVAFVCLLTFDSPLQILLPPLSILAVNIVEGQFLTPTITGRQLSLSPVAVFLCIVVLGWIWGLIGVLIAVPTLATIKLICEHVESLSPVATFLGRY